MSCNDHHYDSNCVCEVLKFINELQDAVEENTSCPTACNIYPLGTNCVSPLANTRAIMLFCGCNDIFLPANFFNFPCLHDDKSHKKTLTLFSPFVRVESVDDCCAVFKALTPDFSNLDDVALMNLGMALESALENGGYSAAARVLAYALMNGVSGEKGSPDFFTLSNSGICMTVDTKCFCAIQCLRDVYINGV